MPKISYILPVDQPTGNRRLYHELGSCLDGDDYEEFRFSVAYAKSGPLVRLNPLLIRWMKEKKKLCAVFGVDQKGTSVQALRIALRSFDETYITFAAAITFHPKVYLFRGKSKATAFIGSNNLTVGGLELNFEFCIRLDFSMPSERDVFLEAAELWDCLLPNRCTATHRLTPQLLDKLVAANALFDESDTEARESQKKARAGSLKLRTVLGSDAFSIKPPSPLPKSTMETTSRSLAASEIGRKASKAPQVVNALSNVVRVGGLVIQIAPHHNGEIFLSKKAVRQQPSFFGWPFSGTTTPKKAGNKGYPQRDPDPIVNITVYGAKRRVILRKDKYALNTVYYSEKSEIRITASPLVGVVPKLSVMIMQESPDKESDYEMTIHTPDSPDYGDWVNFCNQSMPSGGARRQRKFGWF